MPRQFCGRTRREFLWETGAGFGAVALTSLLSDDLFFDKQAAAAQPRTAFISPMMPKKPHHTPKAKSVIFLFMYGGPSQVDTFDYKPELQKRDGNVGSLSSDAFEQQIVLRPCDGPPDLTSNVSPNKLVTSKPCEEIKPAASLRGGRRAG